MLVLDPRQVLDKAVGCQPGEGVKLSFPNSPDRDRFRWKCYGTMSAEAKASKRELDPESEGWGKHSWEGVMILREGELDLWIGREAFDDVVMTENVPMGG